MISGKRNTLFYFYGQFIEIEREISIEWMIKCKIIQLDEWKLFQGIIWLVFMEKYCEYVVFAYIKIIIFDRISFERGCVVLLMAVFEWLTNEWPYSLLQMIQMIICEPNVNVKAGLRLLTQSLPSQSGS